MRASRPWPEQRRHEVVDAAGVRGVDGHPVRGEVYHRSTSEHARTRPRPPSTPDGRPVPVRP
ncbi:hypothetical protein, partial [Lentzea sp. NPDC060358]|uniref:hypothetical protein n=1 Tax=Lentzea sp. NPDC060358 TaxID=3347103 RepID=UPI00364F653C